MKLRTTLTIPLLSATLAITVPAAGQMTDEREEQYPSQNQGRLDQQQQQQQRPFPQAQPADGMAADQHQAQQQAKEAQQQAKAQAFARTSDLLGQAIRSEQGEELGELQDIVVEPRSGDIKYAVLARGGALGIGGDLHAIPMSALSKRAGEEHLTAKLTVEQLDEAQGFDADNWPDAANEALGDPDLAQPAMGATPGGEAEAGEAAAGTWRSAEQPRNPAVRGEQHAGESAIGQAGEGRMTDDARTQAPQGQQMAEDAATEAQREVQRIREEIRQRALAENTRIIPLDRENLWAHKVSELSGASVEAAGEELGSISDLVIDLNRDKLAYAIVSYGGTLGVGDRMVAVPWSAVEIDRQNDQVVLDTPRQTLDQLAFEGDQFPDFADQQWAQRTHRAFGVEPEESVFGYSIEAGEQGQQQQGQQQQDQMHQGRMQDQSGQQQRDTTGPPDAGSPYDRSPQDTGQQQQGQQQNQQEQQQQ